ncbi:hypothetical protein [Nocardia wallacei]|uniref:hypothetical protein n=1 Tax=Nocardia wallacei TaxID=480035 RepID=UPI0024588DAE|nr:hypothetical protein [Nocardia wallacei]
MMQATIRYTAVFADQDYPVMAWSETGEALIVDTDAGCLVAARERAGFSGLERTDEYCRTYRSLIAAQGWCAHYRRADGSLRSVPVVAWALCADDPGVVVPLVSTADGCVEPADQSAPGHERFHSVTGPIPAASHARRASHMHIA